MHSGVGPLSSLIQHLILISIPLSLSTVYYFQVISALCLLLTVPDFAQVYTFIGSMFDPNITWRAEHFFEKLQDVDPVTAKIVSQQNILNFI